MPRTTNNLVTKPYFKTELKKELKALESRRDKQLDRKLARLKHELKEDIRTEIKVSEAGIKYDIITTLSDKMTKNRTDILGAVADFGKRVQDMETNDTIIIHRLDQAGIPGI